MFSSVRDFSPKSCVNYFLLLPFLLLTFLILLRLLLLLGWHYSPMTNFASLKDFSHSALFLTPSSQLLNLHLLMSPFSFTIKQNKFDHSAIHGRREMCVIVKWMCECCLNILVQIECNQVRKIGNVFSLQNQFRN